MKLTPMRVSRRSTGLLKKLEECMKMMKSVNAFVHATANRIKQDEERISVLVKQNQSLRHALGLKNKKVKKTSALPTMFPFIFPGLSDSPTEILNRKIEEILPLEDNLNSSLKHSRTRVLTMCYDTLECETVADLLRKAPHADGPRWKWFLKYRNYGPSAHLVLTAALNHFKVDRKNLPSTIPESGAGY